MKKILLFLTALLPIAAQAQVSDGYYRILNNASARYITINNDIVGEVNMSATKADLSNIITYRGFDRVKSNPASIIYINQIGSQYNLSAQGTSIYKIAGGRTYLDFLARGECYLLSVTYSGVSGKLEDSSDSRERGSVTHANTVTPYMYWRMVPVDTGDNYIGLKPTVEAADGYYGTLYAEYPFKKVSDGIKIYYVNSIEDGKFQMKEITDEIIPGATPLVFKCNSNDPAQNKIMPVYADTFAPDGNKLKGTYFACTTNNHEEYIEYSSKTMRVLGVDADKNLTLTKASESYLADGWMIPMNTCWYAITNGYTGDYKLDSGTSGIRTIESNTQPATAQGTFTLTGVKVEKPTQPGIYIQNGKKVVIK